LKIGTYGFFELLIMNLMSDFKNSRWRI